MPQDQIREGSKYHCRCVGRLRIEDGIKTDSFLRFRKPRCMPVIQILKRLKQEDHKLEGNLEQNKN